MIALSIRYIDNTSTTVNISKKIFLPNMWSNFIRLFSFVTDKTPLFYHKLSRFKKK